MSAEKSTRLNKYVKIFTIIGVIVTILFGLFDRCTSKDHNSENKQPVTITHQEVEDFEEAPPFISIDEIENIPKNNYLEFDTNPGGNVGTLSIAKMGCGECGGIYNEHRVEIPNYLDTEIIIVFLDFKKSNNISGTITNARGYIDTKIFNGIGPDYSILGSLFARNAIGVIDDVKITNLPESFAIRFKEGTIKNTHGGKDGCHDNYKYEVPVNTTLLFNPNVGAYLGDLDSSGTGMCAQGSIILTYEVINTTIK